MSISPQRQAVLDWLEGFNKWDADAIAAPMSDESFEHQLLPTSLNRPRRSKQEFVDYIRNDVVFLLRDFKVTVDEIIEEPGKVVVQASSTAQSTTGFPYYNEFMIIFHLQLSAVDGVPRITLIKEFVDSAFTVNFFAEEKVRIAASKGSTE
ncbi:hypothetical protein BDN72DRAFT_846132 [Pluteus cervinus]|uniref:Uncharacterized protein n=1 Tax=Pluteus cervinus TaxID=181527 RepID=A0ACD3AHV1_9AGAR|nr:hypothetical protein BDN72DRAFT_846132 [Pluteus cervinus]